MDGIGCGVDMQLRLLLALVLLALPAGAQVNAPFRFVFEPPAGGGDEPVVNSTATSREASDVTTHTITLPATVESGELLLVICSFNGVPTVTWDNTSHGTWTQINNAGNATVRLVTQVKVADGTEDGGTLSVTTSVGEKSATVAFAIGTWEGTIAGGVQSPATTNGNNQAPDSAAATDSWGTVPRKTLTMFAQEFNQAVDAWPSGYTLDQQLFTSTGTGSTSVGVAGRNGTEGSQDPPAFDTNVTAAWRASTISVRGTS